MTTRAVPDLELLGLAPEGWQSNEHGSGHVAFEQSALSGRIETSHDQFGTDTWRVRLLVSEHGGEMDLLSGAHDRMVEPGIDAIEAVVTEYVSAIESGTPDQHRGEAQ